MGANADPNPRGRRADQRWKDLGRARRWALVRGEQARDEREALTALAYGRRMRERSQLVALIGAIAAFVVYCAIAILVEGDLRTQTMILAAGAGIGVGVGLEIAGRRRGRRLELRAEEALREFD